MIRHAVAAGRLIRVYRGVYAVGALPLAPAACAHGALLAVGTRSALAGASAASVYGLRRSWQRPFTVITPLDRRIRGVDVRHCRLLRRRDITVVEGLRVVSPALTVLHYAAIAPPKRLVRAIDDLRLDHGLRTDQLDDVLVRYTRHRGARALRRAVGQLEREPTRSTWEQEWRAFADRFQLPPHDTNVLVAGHRVDVLFPGRLIVEQDGWGTHGTYHAFIADRERDADILARTGLPTMRITYVQFQREAARIAERILRIVAPPGGRDDSRSSSVVQREG